MHRLTLIFRLYFAIGGAYLRGRAFLVWVARSGNKPRFQGRHSLMEDRAKELLGRGIYTLAEASQLTGIESKRLLRWLRGYEFKLRGEKQKSDRVIHGELPVIDDSYALSFLDLQEARCIAEFRKRRVGWPALRTAHERAREAMQLDHPFSTGHFTKQAAHTRAQRLYDVRMNGAIEPVT